MNINFLFMITASILISQNVKARTLKVDNTKSILNGIQFNEEQRPVVGKPCPDFAFQNMEDYNVKTITLNGLKGKPFVIDFFSTGCTACFKSMPKISGFNQSFNGKVSFFMIGHSDQYIKRSYETYKRRYHLTIPHTYDTTFFTKWGVWGVPWLVWVNSDGIVAAITSSETLTESNVTAFSRDQPFLFNDISLQVPEITIFNYHKPFLLNGNGGNDSLFCQRSLFAKWKKEMGAFTYNQIETYQKLGDPLQIVGWPLFSLYQFAYINRIADWTADDTAYFGKYTYYPILEMRDSSLFKFDWDLETNKFCYSQVLPKEQARPENMLRIMQEDLRNCFGYDAKIEIRQMPYLRLVWHPSKSHPIKSAGGAVKEEAYPGGIDFKNASMGSLMIKINYAAYLVSKDLPLMDETGISYPIDIKFDATMTDIEDVKKAMEPFGFEMIPGFKEMKVLVIRDGKQ